MNRFQLDQQEQVAREWMGKSYEHSDVQARIERQRAALRAREQQGRVFGKRGVEK